MEHDLMQHRNRVADQARALGVPFSATPDEWIRLWAGRYPDRKRQGLVMRRIEPARGWVTGNLVVEPRKLATARLARPERRPLVRNTSVAPLPQRVREFERGLLVDAIGHAGGNRAQAARELNISYRSIIHLIKKHRLA